MLDQLGLGLGRIGVFDPALVIGSNVVPAILKLVAHSPHEMCLNSVVEDTEGALAERLHVILRVVIGVNRAHALLDKGEIAQGLALETEGAHLVDSTVEIDTVLGHISLRALNALTGARCHKVGVVEASEPGSADVGSEGPLTNPDIIFDILRDFKHITVGVTV